MDPSSVVETPNMVLFYTKACVFSQHNTSYAFAIDGQTYNCAEQYMMAEKARLFKDHEKLAAILSETDPQRQKRLGRQVTPFDKDRWDEVAYDVVVRGNLAKFRQNEEALRALLATGDKELVEASPRDRIWGIGLGANNPKALDKANWRGKNLLGKALMEVRSQFLCVDAGATASPDRAKRPPTVPPGAPLKRQRQEGACWYDEDED